METAKKQEASAFRSLEDAANLRISALEQIKLAVGATPAEELYHLSGVIGAMQIEEISMEAIQKVVADIPAAERGVKRSRGSEEITDAEFKGHGEEGRQAKRHRDCDVIEVEESEVEESDISLGETSDASLTEDEAGGPESGDVITTTHPSLGGIKIQVISRKPDSFGCMECKPEARRAFSHLDAVEHHIRRHHTTIPLRCQLCVDEQGVEFWHYNWSTFSSHIKSQHGERLKEFPGKLKTHLLKLTYCGKYSASTLEKK